MNAYNILHSTSHVIVKATILSDGELHCEALCVWHLLWSAPVFMIIIINIIFYTSVVKIPRVKSAYDYYYYFYLQ